MPHIQKWIHFRKDAFKFASAHMTVFPDGTKEALHGHNYSTEISLEVESHGLRDFTPFSALKKPLADLCAKWDEKVLLASRCPFFEVKSRKSGEIDFTLCGKHYVLPEDEVVTLEIENISAENLAEEFSRLYLSLLDPAWVKKHLRTLLVKIEESPGQGATHSWKNS